MKIYAVAIIAQRIIDNISQVRCVALAILAESEMQAEVKVFNEAARRCPKSEGWGNYQADLVEIPSEWYTEVRND